LKGGFWAVATPVAAVSANKPAAISLIIFVSFPPPCRSHCSTKQRHYGRAILARHPPLTTRSSTEAEFTATNC
jgi:hypothetical protein